MPNVECRKQSEIQNPKPEHWRCSFGYTAKGAYRFHAHAGNRRFQDNEGSDIRAGDISCIERVFQKVTVTLKTVIAVRTFMPSLMKNALLLCGLIVITPAGRGAEKPPLPSG